jgi:hypothetical protein
VAPSVTHLAKPTCSPNGEKQTQRDRAFNRLGHNFHSAPFGPVTLFAEPAVYQWQVEAPSIVRKHATVIPKPVHLRTLGLSGEWLKGAAHSCGSFDDCLRPGELGYT